VSKQCLRPKSLALVMSPGCLAIAGQSMDEDDASSASMVSSWTDLVARGIILHNYLVGLGEGSEAIVTLS
jgi:hypothetical protein